ncbi:hypothetical protein QR680_010588 [Steinernema hermaphroditum]|uniref:Major facilitator superfamily (MFS) profile domain-containing protein n=1 Tax=Steinernema hermaphroditum TaxID=289476 RepID=A0AA39IPI3_9BILA|nr:hypothetical protein QR680_010588 [Steinernema hermaphroditum]
MASSYHRYAVLCITLLTMTMLIGNSVLFNFTVICMDPSERALQSSNATRFYTPEEEGWLIAAPPIGHIFGTIPAIFLTDRIGMRLSFSIYGLISGISTFLFAFSASNLYVATLLRFFQGIAMASAFVAVGNVPIEYGQVKRKALFLSLLSCAYQLGPTSAIPSSALFCSMPIGFAAFFVIYRNAIPSRVKSSAKVLPVEDGTSRPKITHMPPYWDMFTSLSVWGIFSTGIGDSLAFLVFFFYGPIYVNKVLHFEIEQTGILAALPHLCSMLAKMATGFFLHNTGFKDSSKVVLISNIVIQGLMTVNLLVLTTLGSGSPFVAEALIVLTVTLAGIHFIAMMTAAQIVAQQHTHVISCAMAALESLFGLLLPPFVSTLAPHHTSDEWVRVFYCIIGFLIVTNIIFALATKLKPAEWTKEDHNTKRTEVVHIE